MLNMQVPNTVNSIMTTNWWSFFNSYQNSDIISVTCFQINLFPSIFLRNPYNLFLYCNLKGYLDFWSCYLSYIELLHHCWPCVYCQDLVLKLTYAYLHLHICKFKACLFGWDLVNYYTRGLFSHFVLMVTLWIPLGCFIILKTLYKWFWFCNHIKNLQISTVESQLEIIWLMCLSFEFATVHLTLWLSFLWTCTHCRCEHSELKPQSDPALLGFYTAKLTGVIRSDLIQGIARMKLLVTQIDHSQLNSSSTVPATSSV